MTPEMFSNLVAPWVNMALSGGLVLLAFKIWGKMNKLFGQNAAEHKSMQLQINQNNISLTDAHRRIDTFNDRRN